MVDKPTIEPETVTVELREEELIAEKRLVQLGVLRIRREVISETRTIEVAVSREEVIVERLPLEAGSVAGSELAGADQLDPTTREQLRALQLGEILRLPIVEEEVIIQKRPMVTRELIIDKRLVEEVRTVSDTVRREDARVVAVAPPQPAADRGAAATAAEAAAAPVPEAEPRDARVQAAGGTLELRVEELEPHTRVVDAGVVQVRTGVVSGQQRVVVRLSHEQTRVQQIAVDPRPAERPIGSREDILEIPEYGEQVSLAKRPVVSEELSIHKEVVADVQHVTTTLRREVAHVETEGDVRAYTPDDVDA